MLESSEEVDSTAEEAGGDEAQVEPAKDEPRRETRVRKFDFVRRRNWFFLISLIIIVPGIISMATRGFLLGIDFAGGTEFTLTFTDRPSAVQVESAVAAENIHGTVISAGSDYIIRAIPLSPAGQAQVVNDLKAKLGPVVTKQVLEVGGTIAGETIEFALLAIVLASVAILFLLAIRFRNVPGGWRAGFQFGGDRKSVV